jgi:hypothetical protein
MVEFDSEEHVGVKGGVAESDAGGQGDDVAGQQSRLHAGIALRVSLRVMSVSVRSVVLGRKMIITLKKRRVGRFQMPRPHPPQT